MRIYRNFIEAVGEVKRDVVEMGHRIHPKTYQDKYVADNDDFKTLEVTNYIYSVTEPELEDLTPTLPWADLEFAERISGVDWNPGTAWEANKEVWEQFLITENLPAIANPGKKFGYTYAERITWYNQVEFIVNALEYDPDSRQCFMAIWEPEDLEMLGGVSRVPCTIGYLFQIRPSPENKKQLNITYLQRSSDLHTHYMNDVYLAIKMQRYIAEQVKIQPGYFTHWLGSIHLFKKDARDIF